MRGGHSRWGGDLFIREGDYIRVSHGQPLSDRMGSSLTGTNQYHHRESITLVIFLVR